MHLPAQGAFRTDLSLQTPASVPAVDSFPAAFHFPVFRPEDPPRIWAEKTKLHTYPTHMNIQFIRILQKKKRCPIASTNVLLVVALMLR